jgi:LemA protein
MMDSSGVLVIDGVRATVAYSQLMTIMVPLCGILLLVWLIEEVAERFSDKNRLAAWVDGHIVACRVVGISLLSVFYVYEMAWWYNMDMSELNNISMSKAQVGKEYKRREDLVLNLTNVANNYAQHERVLFQHVSDMRAQLQVLEMTGGAPSAAQSAKLEAAFMRLMALAEQYPDLKAEQRYHDLMDIVEVTEDRIAEKTDEYLEMLLEFNTCNQCFWCNYWTFLVAPFVPLPAYWEYYHADHAYAPVVQAEGPPGPVPDQAVPAPVGVSP